MSHRMTQQMRVELEAADRTVFVAEIPAGTIIQRPTSPMHLAR